MSFKICNIGCGDIATSVHGPAYVKYRRLHPDVVLAACCDIDETRAEIYRKKFGFDKYYTDYRKMLEAERPDAVCLICPDTVTAEISINIFKMGYPLLLEKPPGRNREETLKMIEAAEKAGLANQAAFNRRYVPLVRELKRLLESDFTAGQIHNIRYDFYRVERKDFDFSATAIHGIDTVRFLAGSDYEYIKFNYQELPHIGINVANIYMYCTFRSGAAAQLNFCPVSGTVIERATVNCYNHTFFLNIPIWAAMDSPGRLVHIESNQVRLDVTGEQVSDGSEMFEENGFYAENASFFNDIRTGKKPVNDIRSGLQSVEVADCIRKRLPEYIG